MDTEATTLYTITKLQSKPVQHARTCTETHTHTHTRTHTCAHVPDRVTGLASQRVDARLVHVVGSADPAGCLERVKQVQLRQLGDDGSSGTGSALSRVRACSADERSGGKVERRRRGKGKKDEYKPSIQRRSRAFDV